MYQPTKQDFENAYRKITTPGTEVEISIVVQQVEEDAKLGKLELDPNWFGIFSREHLEK